MFRSLSALLVGGLLVIPLNAQTTKTPKPKPIATFDTFLDAHPTIEQDLEKNPSLLKDSTYLAAHPELKTFLADNPKLAKQAAENPKAVIKHLDKFERSGKDISKADLAAFDDYMDKHSDLEKQVRKNPSLLTNADFLAKNPDLKTFLAAHPSMQQEINEQPRVFMKAENHYEHTQDDRKADGPPKQAKIEHHAPPPVPHPAGKR